MACPRLLLPSILVGLVYASGGTFASMPEPPRRPPDLDPIAEQQVQPAEPATPAIDPACAAVLADPGVDAAVGDPLSDAGGCGMASPVTLRRVRVVGERWVAFEAPPVVNCAAATALAAWVRDLAKHGPTSRVAALVTGAGYECRPRNRVPGAKLSEHGTGNAVDIRGLRMADASGKPGSEVVVPSDEGYRELTCARFSTVLGHGSDRYHGDHTHLDIAIRRSGYRICQFAPAVPPQGNVNDKATP